MANPKYFHVRNVPQDKDYLVRALKPEQAVAAIDTAPAPQRPATDDEIAAYFANDGHLHEKSCEEGQGKYFLVQTTPDPEAVVLVRAKNAAAAVSAANEGVYTVEPASQDVLVRLLTTGAPKIDAVPAPPAASAPDSAPTPTAPPPAVEPVATEHREPVEA